MAALGDVIDNIAATVQRATGIRTIPYIVESPPAPCAMVYPERCDYSKTFGRGVDQWSIKVQLVIPLNSDRATHRLMYDWLSGAGPQSVRQAIYQAPTLGTDPAESPAGAAASMNGTVSEMVEYGVVFTLEGVRFLSATLNVTVLTSGAE